MLVAAIVHQIYWTPHKIYIHKVRAYIGIIGNKIVDTLVNEETFKDNPATTPCIHIAHTTPYWLASYHTATHNDTIRNLNTLKNKNTKNKNPMQPKQIPMRWQMAIKWPNKPQTIQLLMEKSREYPMPNSCKP